MSDIALIDAETIAALKVLRGDNTKDANSVDKEFSSGLAQQIVDALSSQKEASSAQNSELVAAVREQTAALQQLTELLQTKQKTTVVVVNKDQSTTKEASSVASTAVETDMVSIITEDPSNTIAAAVTAADNATPVVMPPVITEPEIDPKEAITRGPWGFVESEDAAGRRSRVTKSEGKFRYLEKGEEVPSDAFKPISHDAMLNKEDSLFGNVSGNELQGDCFGAYWEKMRNRVDQYGKLQAPKWAIKGKGSVRSYLPMLSIDGKTKIDLRTGIYYLTVKYEATKSSKPIEAAIIVGELAFDNNGSVLAPGAKLKKLLSGQKQKEPRVANAKPKWYTSMVSDPWKNGDVMRFKINTNSNTVTYTLSSAGSDEIKAGWKFENVLSFTSVPTYRKYIRVFAYCGTRGTSSPAKLTIVDDKPKEAVPSSPGVDSVSTMSAEGGSPINSEERAEPELEVVVESAEAENEVEESADPVADPAESMTDNLADAEKEE